MASKAIPKKAIPKKATAKKAVKSPVMGAASVKLTPKQLAVIDSMKQKVSDLKMQIGNAALQRSLMETQLDQITAQIGTLADQVAKVDQEMKETLFAFLRDSGTDPGQEPWVFQFPTNSFVKTQ